MQVLSTFSPMLSAINILTTSSKTIACPSQVLIFIIIQIWRTCWCSAQDLSGCCVFRETNTEQKKQRAISYLDSNVSFNHGLVCHLLTMEHILSWVRSMPWKLIRGFFALFCFFVLCFVLLLP